jgi:hypothetical protein
MHKLQQRSQQQQILQSAAQSILQVNA